MIRFGGANPCNCTPQRTLIAAHCCPPPGVSLSELLRFSDEFVNEPVSGAPRGWTAFADPGTFVGRDTSNSIQMTTTPSAEIAILADVPRIAPATDELCACVVLQQIAPAPIADAGGIAWGLVDPALPDPTSFLAAVSFAVPGFWVLVWSDGIGFTPVPTTIPVTGGRQSLRLCSSTTSGIVTLTDGTITASAPRDANFPTIALAPVLNLQGGTLAADGRFHSYCAEWRPG